MPTAAVPHAPKPTGPFQALFRSTLQQASSDGAVLMGRIVTAARQLMQAQEAALRDHLEREALAVAANQLRRQEQSLCAAYPQALLKAFSGPPAGKQQRALSMADVQFHELELMDEMQVQTTISLARIQQSVMQVAEGSLGELNTLVCSLLGMGSVRAELNPLRPESYINALKEVVEQSGLSDAQQLLWFNAMSGVLGPALHGQYQELCASLRQQGVLPVSFAVPVGFGGRTGAATSPNASQAGAGGEDLESAFQTQAAPLMDEALYASASGSSGRDPSLLTLDKLRSLLAGELAPVMSGLSRMEQFAAQFSQQFDATAAASPAAAAPDTAASDSKSGFDATVPAALEALTEMKQVDRVMQSLEQRRHAPGADAAVQTEGIVGQRQALRLHARSVAQAISLEVVTLMVDNMARDPRLLEPIARVIRGLEPALLRLALVDPRFFSDKQHPARRLLHEVTDHSLAFDSSSATGFDRFLGALESELTPLSTAPVESADVFEGKLAALRQLWSLDSAERSGDRARAVDVLSHAEARNLLAETIGRGIASHPDSAKVPGVVIDFLCGPWAQVVAQARIKQGPDSETAKKFDALVSAMLWSAHPELARADPNKLSRAVPRLLATLREGLDTIEYPATRTSVFLEALMAIHQKVFRANMAPEPVAQDAQMSRPFPVLDDDPWVAPREARESNFVEFSEVVPMGEPAQEHAQPERQDEAVPDPLAVVEMPLGNWVELLVNGQWIRTQLTWASPHGTLFLFTGAFGATQSMTRRSRDRLLATGKLRLLSGQSVDEGALNAVAQTAMRNSVDSTF
jgi:hypothetical protein